MGLTHLTSTIRQMTLPMITKPCVIKGTASLLFLLSILTSQLSSFGQGTAFSYLGRLNQGAIAANGNYDLKFALFGASAGGAAIAGPLTVSAVPVNNGLFTVTLDFGNQFDGTPRFLEIGVSPSGAGAFTTLSPRQPLTPTPYAIFAGNASGVAAGSVVQSLNTLKDNVPLAPGANVSITPSGNTLTIASAGAGGSGIWSLNGPNTYFNGGSVGIGTSTPGGLLDIVGQDAIRIEGFNPCITLYDSNANNERGRIQSVSGGLNFFTENYLNGSDPFGYIRLDGSGNVGIGTAQPIGKLEVVAQDALRLIGYNPFLTLYDSNAGYARGRIQSVGGGMNFFTENYLNGSNPWGYLRLDGNGFLGIGTATPSASLDVRGSGLTEATVWSTAERAILSLHSTVLGTDRVWTLESGVFGIPGLFGIYDRSSGQARLTIDTSGNVNVNGPNVSVCTLTIRGGCDLAEPFPTTEGNVDKGSVMVIDEEHPGQLKLSHRAYDTRVAGIASGANGINPGISLRQEGPMDAGQDVALSGRVYVQADASFGAIKPGDLLTTSDTPGYAMRVADHARAQGAILGKAMSGLSQGKGMVLVLVTLQ